MALLLVGTACLTVLILWFIPKLQVRRLKSTITADRVKELENEFRKTIAQIIGGVLILAGFLFTWQQILASRQKEATDRLTAAIGHLASDQQPIRVAGAYALGRIMRDSPAEGSVVIDILSAFVREKAAWKDKDNQLPKDLRPDIQAAVKVIGQRPKEVDDQFEPYSIDFSSSDLRRGQFAKCRFAHARMLEAHLDLANLEGADLRSAQLQGSVLDDANLRTTNLQGADLTATSIRGAHFEGANLSGIKGLTADDVRKRSAFVDEKTVFR